MPPLGDRLPANAAAATRTSAARPDFVVDTKFGVIHEDEHLLILDKPAPLAVHPVGAYQELNLHSLLRKDPRWAGRSIRFAHRLDAETSGVIIATKTEEAARHMGIEFLKNRVEKVYHALVFGTMPNSEGEIDIRLGNDLSSGFQTVRIRDDRTGEEAVTRYRSLWSAAGYSWVELRPRTGRTHQLRAHMSMIGHPIVGDKIYIDVDIFRRYVIGGLSVDMLKKVMLPRLALHSSFLHFRHPATGDPVEFSSRPPAFMQQVPLD